MIELKYNIQDNIKDGDYLLFKRRDNIKFYLRVLYISNEVRSIRVRIVKIKGNLNNTLFKENEEVYYI